MSSLVIFEDSVSHHRSIEAAGLAGFLVKTQLGVCCLQEGLTEEPNMGRWDYMDKSVRSR